MSQCVQPGGGGEALGMVVVVKMGSSTATSGTRRPLMQRMEYFFFSPCP